MLNIINIIVITFICIWSCLLLLGENNYETIIVHDGKKRSSKKNIVSFLNKKITFRKERESQILVFENKSLKLKFRKLECRSYPSDKINLSLSEFGLILFFKSIIGIILSAAASP